MNTVCRTDSLKLMMDMMDFSYSCQSSPINKGGKRAQRHGSKFVFQQTE